MDAVEKYVDNFVTGLHGGGVRDAVVCPGSRSTPLVLSLARRRQEELFRTWVLYDERSAGFFAMGMARSSSRPVALLCTSGSAAANFLPAVVESIFSRIPLVVVTADRPPELRGFGGAQTIDQIRLYGTHVKWFHDMPTAADLPVLMRHSAAVGLRAAHLSASAPAGPVHVNFSFRDPLLSAGPEVEAQEAVAAPEFSVSPPASLPSESSGAVAKEIARRSRGIVVVGPGRFSGLRKELSSLSRVLGWPVLADALSNLRQGGGFSGLIRSYELLLRNPSFRDLNRPEWVLRLGGLPTSKELNLFCEGARTVVLEEEGLWRDPDFTSTMVFGDPGESLSRMARSLRGFERPRGWLAKWRDEDERAGRRLDSVMRSIVEPFEGKLFHLLAETLEPSSPLTVLVGNSMPVRDLDCFFRNGSGKIHLEANRGANGIDGLVSTAMGIAATEGNVVLVLGDVSFYHDMNGLLPSRLYGLKATVVVVNNEGGGIFSFLPQHALPGEVFERFFGEGHDLDFSGVRTIYGGRFYRVRTWSALRAALSASLEEDGLKVVEFHPVGREDNLALHRKVFEELSSGVRS